MRTVLLTLGQLAGAACALYALAVLAGWPWSLLAGGLALGAACVWTEAVDGPSVRQRRITRALKNGGE